MKTLLQQWNEVKDYDADSLGVEQFRQNLRMVVARDYCWLCGELFRIEGELGWGPGFRDYDGDEMFPPETWEAKALMTTFLNTLERVDKDKRLIAMLSDSRKGRAVNKATAMLRKCRGARVANRNAVIHHFYLRIARGGNAATYSLAAARVYRSLWTQQNKFLLALAGLINLFCTPLTELTARAETVERKMSFHKRQPVFVQEGIDSVASKPTTIPTEVC